MFKAQKCSKDIDKIIHVTSVVQTEFDKAMRILFVQTKQKQLLYLTIYSLPCQSSTHAFTRVPRCMRVHSLLVNKAYSTVMNRVTIRAIFTGRVLARISILPKISRFWLFALCR